MLKNIIEKIQDPPVEFRSAPFWAWNAKLEPDELRRQIRIMKEMGMGAFFMHSRVGLDTPYLGKEWFDCIRSCIDEAEKQGMLAWLYDEDRWPSGAAGGLVTDEERFRSRELQLSDRPLGVGVILGSFAITQRKKGTEIAAYRRLASPDDPLAPGENRAVFSRQIAEPMAWYNGQTYIDAMNEEAVRKFIRVTHERYAKEIGDKFGNTVRGIFTDEPHYLPGLFSENNKTLRFKDGRIDRPFNYSSLPWTDSIPERFRAKFGYDLLERLPELFFEIEGEEEFSKTRLDFFNLITELFVNAFSKQIGEWCGKHRLEFIGHLLCEDTLLLQRLRVGACMRFYEYMQAPSVDLLTEHRAVYDTAKQCTSVAHQFGRRWRLTETYGCTGWDFPLFGHKALGDMQFALGINLRCQHLAWYSMAAEAKRDYPASISFQAPWHRQYHVVEDHFARLGAALSEGEEVRDLLVIHPIESTWGWKHEPNLTDEERLREDNTLIDLRNQLLTINLDFDYGDEAILARHAAVEGDSLRVELASYKAVLIPRLRTIRRSTLDLLAAFRRAGGLVVYLAPAPPRVDGVRSPDAERVFADFTPVTPADFDRVLSPACREISLLGPDGRQIGAMLSILRRGEDFQTLFVCNTGHRLDSFQQMEEPMVRDRKLTFPEVEVRLRSRGAGEIVEVDPDTGLFHAVPSEMRGGFRVFRTSFGELGSRIFLEGDFSEAAASPRAPEPVGETVLTLPAAGWKIRRDEPNVLVLDHGRYTVDGGRKWSEKLFFIKLDAEVRALLGKPPRSGAMVQPYIAVDRTPKRTLPLEVEFTFECAELPRRDIELVLERPDLYTVLVNGEALELRDTGYWADPAQRKLALPLRFLRTGTNRLLLRCDYHEFLPGLESPFLLGDFGVKDDTIIALPEEIAVGDWCEQGFPHYSGNFTYVCRMHGNPAGGKPLFLEFGAWRGASLGVSVNGGKLHPAPWQPFRVKIGSELTDGDNEIAITVFGHRRNAYGPFYLEETWPPWSGPLQFKAYLQPKRNLVPCGLLEPPVLKR